MVERTPIQLGRLDLRQLGIEWIEAGAGARIGVCRRTIWIVTSPPRPACCVRSAEMIWLRA